MGIYLGITFVLLLFGMIMHGSQSFFSLKDLDIPKCRIVGVTIIKVNTSYLFNYTNAEAVCQLMGLDLASKWQVTKAHHHGYETCSYGWVSDKISIISRTQPNTKCGQNKTGVLLWHANISKLFHAYCFNSSDTWINSCKPDSTTTAETSPLTESASTPAKTSATLKPAARDSSTMFQTLKPAATKYVSSHEFRQLTTASSLPTERTTAEVLEENIKLLKRQDALLNNSVVFGGLPTGLLVLALVFFVIAAVLAICYVRKYVEKVPFSSKKKQKEDVDIKVFKERRTSDDVANKEQKNGKPVENTENMPVATAQCAEAEV